MKTCGRSNGERFTGGWKGSIRGGSGIEITGLAGITGNLGGASTGGLDATPTEGLGTANTGASTKGRWNCAASCSRSDSLSLR
jgi:hypothetical protein